MIGCMAPLPLLVLAFKYYCMVTFEDQCKYYNKAILDDPAPAPLGDSDKKGRGYDRVAAKFGHPALYKTLITPMVHAKARHVLANIYRGRLDSDAAGAPGYSDIAMNPMSKSDPGRYAGLDRNANLDGAKNDMFEMVPESNLDFAYYKNRADFRDEYGGEGELYGRPPDLATDGSQTAYSFMTGSGGPRSRSQSPAPMPVRMGHQRPRDSQGRPSFQAQADVGAQRMYNMSNDSDRRLLSDPQTPGSAYAHGGLDHDDDDQGHEQYGLDRWRTPRSGYMGVPGTADEVPLNYDAYRRAQ